MANIKREINVADLIRTGDSVVLQRLEYLDGNAIRQINGFHQFCDRVKQLKRDNEYFMACVNDGTFEERIYTTVSNDGYDEGMDSVHYIYVATPKGGKVPRSLLNKDFILLHKSALDYIKVQSDRADFSGALAIQLKQYPKAVESAEYMNHFIEMNRGIWGGHRVEVALRCLFRMIRDRVISDDDALKALSFIDTRKDRN